MILDDLSEPVINRYGINAEKWRLKLDMEKEDVIVDLYITRLRLKRSRDGWEGGI